MSNDIADKDEHCAVVGILRAGLLAAAGVAKE